MSEPTTPFALPPLPPKISDSQRSKVFGAEAAVEKKLKLKAVSRGDAEVIADIVGVTAEQTGRGSRTQYFRGGRVEFGEATTLPAFLHECAHHLTPPVFPPHGIEWVANFLGLLDKFAPDLREPYEKAFDKRGVRMTVESARHRARRDAVYFANKEHGCLARVVLDDPPQDEICQLLTVGPDALVIFDDTGERELPLDRLRYVSATLSDPA